MTDNLPAGFVPLKRESAFVKLIGPIYERQEQQGLTLGLRIAEKHKNMRGILHGGVVSSLADIAMGYNIAFSTNPPTSSVTASMTVDYVSRVDAGDWLEVQVDIQKLGRRMAFANCFFYVGDKRVARANAVFSIVNQ